MRWSSGCNLKDTTLSPSNFNKRIFIDLAGEMSGNKHVRLGKRWNLQVLANYSCRVSTCCQMAEEFQIQKYLIKKIFQVVLHVILTYNNNNNSNNNNKYYYCCFELGPGILSSKQMKMIKVRIKDK